MEKQTGINKTRIAYATTVVQFALDLADGVVDETGSLDAAYKTAIDRKQALDDRSRDLERLKTRFLHVLGSARRAGQ